MKYGFMAIGLALLGFSCTNEPSTLGLIYGGFDKDYGVVLVDTITVDVSSVLLDSMPTSGTGTLLVGGYSDSHLGKLTAEGYLQIGTGETWEPTNLAYFDSLVLYVKYSGYYYGDTTKEFNLEVRRITQNFKTYTLPQFWIDERQYSALYTPGSLYNSSMLRYDDTPLGSKTFRPRPSNSDSLAIRLDGNLGREFLQFAQNKTETITAQSKFLEYFKGISLVATTSLPSCVLGFDTEDLMIRVYYRQHIDEKLVQQFHDFPFSTELYQYNRIASDRSGSALDNLTRDANELSSEVTGDIAFIQSGAGVVTKIGFPYIRKMIDLKDLLMVNQAQLIIEPLKNSFTEDQPLPVSLSLYETNKSNLPLNQLYADFSTEDYQSAYISSDEEFGYTSGYIFTITEYIQILLSTEGNLDRGLLIMPPANELGKTVNRAYLGAGSDLASRVKLKIWYTQKQ